MRKTTENTEDKNLTAAIDALNCYVEAHAKENKYDIMQVSRVCAAVAWFLTGVQKGFETGDSSVTKLLKDIPEYKPSVEEARRTLARQLK